MRPLTTANYEMMGKRSNRKWVDVFFGPLSTNDKVRVGRFVALLLNDESVLARLLLSLSLSFMGMVLGAGAGGVLERHLVRGEGCNHSGPAGITLLTRSFEKLYTHK